VESDVPGLHTQRHRAEPVEVRSGCLFPHLPERRVPGARSPGPLAELDVTGVGALVVLARFRNSLVEVWRHAAPLAPDEEWILIEAGGDDACHCVVQLASMASPPLRRFVRTLWARCSVT